VIVWGMMRTALLALVLGLLSVPTSAQPQALFGTGPAPVLKEEELDRRFLKTRLNQALVQGTKEPNCVHLVGGLLTILGEIAPYLHERDENFYVDPALVQVLETQLSTPRFQASPALVAMVRRVLIDQKLPAKWLDTAVALEPSVGTIDLGKLRFLAEGVQPIDSYLLTLPVLRERYQVEVQRANATAAHSAEKLFRENYLDRQVLFGGLELVDVRQEKPKKKRRKRGEPIEEEPLPLIARLVWYPPDPDANRLNIFGTPKKRPVVELTVQLAPKQYLELSRLPKGTRLLARGRFWSFKKAVEAVELRDALVFVDRDWSQGALLADPQRVSQCPLAMNELLGAAPAQPGVFGQPAH
jgi:hypothetical protein